MLSKLHASGAQAEAWASPLLSPLNKDVTLEAVSGGTLGLCFRTTHSGERLFLKTHGWSAQARDNLSKEISVLAYLDGDALAVRRVTTTDGRLWLIMKELEAAVGAEPEQVLALTQRNERLLRAYPAPSEIPHSASLSHLLGETEKALNELASAMTLGARVRHETEGYLTLLSRSLPDMPKLLCHGDLGPRNLMMDETGLYAIDWEDAFWGVEGYDYLYWLTFFENRRHHGPQMFGRTPWSKPVEIAILLMVLALKCALSLRNGTHVGNKISFDQRLMEIINLA